MYREMKQALAGVKREVRTYQFVLKDPRTPKLAKWLLGIAIAYFLSPIDIIPDFIPVLGQLDDLAIVSGLLTAALKMIPPEVIAESREKARQNALPKA